MLVLEVGQRVAASAAGSLLAQLGAQVVFVEAQIAFPETKLSYRAQFAAGKKSIVIDPTRAEDRDLLNDLAARCDVLLLSGDIDLDWLDCAALQERLPAQAIVCDVSAFGSSGPMTGVAATDAQVQAMSGIMDTTGPADGLPVQLPIPVIEQLSGIYAASGVLACVLGQGCQSTGRPSVEIALYDVAFSAVTAFLAPTFMGTAGAELSRVGNRHTMAAPWNVYRASDGWVLMCAGNDDQWMRWCDLTGHREQGSSPRLALNADRVIHVDEVDALVQPWVASLSIEECVRQLSSVGIACGPVAPIDAYPREANLQHRRMVRDAIMGPGAPDTKLPGSPLRMSRTPGQALLRVPQPDADRESVRALLQARRAPAAPPAHSTRPARALSGTVVVELGHYTTAPVAARLLAALGAQVIKIEPPTGEAVRLWPPARNGQGVFFTFQNSDKQSLVLELDKKEGCATLTQLLRKADVLVENLRPGALARKGFAPAQLLQINPSLLYCAISGFGADSIYEGRPAFDTVIQAMSGLMDTMHLGDMPLKAGPSLADVLGAVFGMYAMLAGLVARRVVPQGDASGARGQSIDLAMQDIGAWATQTAWNRPGGITPADSVIACADGHVLVTCDAATAQRLADELGAGALTRAALVDALVKAGVRAAPVRGIAEVVHGEQTTSRRLWEVVNQEGLEYTVLASPLRLLHLERPTPRPGPALGRDTQSLMKAFA